MTKNQGELSELRQPQEEIKKPSLANVRVSLLYCACKAVVATFTITNDSTRSKLLYLCNPHLPLKALVATREFATQANYLSVKAGQCCVYMFTSLMFSHDWMCLSLLSVNFVCLHGSFDLILFCMYYISFMFISRSFLSFLFSSTLRVIKRSESVGRLS